MDLSEFKPPVRLSMTDEEIYKALGEAQATEDGIAKAMAIVEEQANLREHDNQVLAEWVARMQSDTRPQAKIALENLEREKQGLQPLPISESLPEPEAPASISEDEIIAALNEAYSATSEPAVEAVETIEDVVEEPAAEISAVEEADEFDALLAEAATEATSAIPVSAPQEFSVAAEPAEEFFVSADEDALVQEEEQEAKLAVKPSGWWDSLGFWAITRGVVLPVVLAYLSVVNGVSLGSALTGFTAASIVVAGLEVARHFTRSRGASNIELANRATFGVFGAALPGLASLAARLTALLVVLLGFVSAFDGAFALNFAFSDEVVPGLTVATLIAVSFALIAFVIALFASRALRFINAVAGLLLVGGFIFAGLATREQIAFDNLDWSVSLDSAARVALFVAASAFLLNGSDRSSRSLARHSAKPLLRWTGFVAVVYVLPLAVYAHFLLAFNMQVSADGFGLLDYFSRVLDSPWASLVLWVTLVGFLALTLNLAAAANESIASFASNRNRWWFGVASLVLISIALWLVPDWALMLQILALLTIPMAAASGFFAADALLRRGEYHEASLLRSYGFYKAANPISLVGFVLVTVGGLALLPEMPALPWLGFSGVSTEFAVLISFGAAIVWQLATALPRIRQQQNEVAEVESRKASLNEFRGFGE